MRFDEFINGAKQPTKPRQFTDMERAIMEGGGSLNDIKPATKSISALRQVVDVLDYIVVTEAFDQPYKLKWEKGDYGDVDAYTKLPDGNYLSIMFNKGYNQDKEEAWNVEFYRNNSQEVTGEGDAQRVFATVLSAIQTFIKKYKPNKVIFSASKEVEQGQNAQSRARLYDSLVQRYARAWGFKAFRADTGNKVIYELSRINKEVDEARTNPDQNPKPESGFKELAAVAKTIADPENWAVSMTAEPKLGINPQVGISEDTPKGIYFYPLNYALDKTRYGKLPWGHDYPYIQLFQYDRSGEMTKQTQVDPAKLKQALSQYCSEEVIQSAIDEPEYDGTPYWFIYDCLSRLGKNDETNVVRWNKVLRDLGFTSVFDNGAGWIAYNEPTQGVVLDPRVIKQHKTIVNKQKSRLVTPAVIEQAIFETMDMELAANRAWQAYDPDGSKLKAAAKEYAKKPEFKQYYGKPGTEEIFNKAEGMGRYGARQLSNIAYEWWKAQRATKESVQVNHEIEVFEDYDTIDQTLRNAGYEELGAGADATVWTKDVGTVIKIIVPEEEDALNTAAETFKKFYEFCMKHQDIECLPKFIPIQGRHYTEFTIKEKTFIQISMERLYPLKNNSFEEAMVWYLSDFATKNTPWAKVKEFLGTPKAWQDTDFSSVANQLALKVSSLKGVKEAKYSLLYTVMTLLYHTGRINKLGWDLHTENAMQRRDGTIVIIDPWFNHEKD